ncbi:DUF1236 domain-containing protein [Aminobacter aganoensis]|uniref:Uncharacterized protein YraI n=1 Tax=Aminobacter aganoensis TaxID=83264 RepID=A0A7X0FBV1_9HYPH|nr:MULTISPECIES: DUF1236 domain-containing protein [Aminobacter]KQU74390.1 hypothetical protein ASC75_21750 [Aminobacter sp. DSM 101952]MBB6356663.1 uncharacterized protein YraI [Aminobacter aganoensis]
MKTKLLFPAVAGALLAFSGPSFADVAVQAATDLNVRAGPGPQYPVVGVIGAGQATTLRGCLESSKWCSVADSGGDGWVYSDYLVGDFGGQQVVLSARPADSGVIVVDPPAAAADVVIDGTTGAIVAGEAMPAIEPPMEVRTYVTDHRIEPVYLDGEVVVGAGLPDTVELTEIPDSEYRYVYVNGQPVLVEPSTRRVVYVMR